MTEQQIKKLMGERGNIIVRQQKDTNRSDVWFYTHWSGYRIGNVVQSALQKHWRWADHSYLARIIFDELTKGDQGSETGFGISTTVQDNQYDLIVVDCDNQSVSIHKDNIIQDGRLPDVLPSPESGKRWSFGQYCTEKLKETE